MSLAKLLTLWLALVMAFEAFAAEFDPVDKSILELQLALNTGQISSAQLVDFYLERIERFDQQGPSLNSMAVINPEARAIALALDK
ncbi:MAG: hypothetical protein NWQ45_06185, partial [Congregibacter sp.]|nr:hypothetical protein [Congregibacter sp.]